MTQTTRSLIDSLLASVFEFLHDHFSANSIGPQGPNALQGVALPLLPAICAAIVERKVSNNRVLNSEFLLEFAQKLLLVKENVRILSISDLMILLPVILGRGD